ncbi:beta subunit of G protein [Guillardia theta]|uniref:Beta subunit of G protein n=1 Tax=Guillardia theta TaxID=55529 RepID=Q9AVX2_GUITH|nr:beta subunit of G protein [Guillardia theta]CAC27099.1 beta subunit of G protein [Guillardia theta]|mmetsp:Transcript_50741/g.158532  ORF Transcript_50741/g.158532 Transcript_50741/m.158532 type:complete len:302 (+) Transcript_50741:5128-6033(+)
MDFYFLKVDFCKIRASILTEKNNKIILGDDKGKVIIIDLISQKIKSSFYIYENFSINEFSSRENLLYCASENMKIPIFDINKNKKIRELCGHEGIVTDVKNKHNYLLSGGKDGFVHLWDTRINLPIMNFVNNGIVDSVGFFEFPNSIHSTYNSNRFNLWDLRIHDKPVSQFQINGIDFYKSKGKITVNEKKNILLFADFKQIINLIYYNQSLKIFYLKSNLIKKKKTINQKVSMIKTDRNFLTIVIVYDEGNIEVFRKNLKKYYFISKISDSRIINLNVKSSGSLLFITCNDGKMILVKLS